LDNKDYDKIFVLDTNVLLHDSQSIFQFKDNLVIIPMVVIEELDNFKKNMDETGRNSRQFSRNMDDLRMEGDISKGIKLKNGGYLKVDTRTTIEKTHLKSDKPDNLILEIAFQEKENNPEKKIILISKDINLRIKASILKLNAEDYRGDNVKFEELYSGVKTIEVSGDLINSFYSNKQISIENISELMGLFPNQYVVLKNMSQSAVGRFDFNKKSIVPLLSLDKKGIWGIFPKNLEQKIAVDLLLNDNIKLVSLVGKAGTGKTLLSVAAGLYKSLDSQAYKKLVVTRPIIPMGKDLGYLPGDIQEKMNPWIKPIMDNIDFLISGGNKNKETLTRGQELIDQGMLEIEPLTYIRGRSMPGLFIILDESQNISPHEAKTIITRAGEGTKIVLTGDCYQIDNPYID